MCTVSKYQKFKYIVLDIYSLVPKEYKLKTNTIVQSLQANISDTVFVNIQKPHNFVHDI